LVWTKNIKSNTASSKGMEARVVTKSIVSGSKAKVQYLLSSLESSNSASGVRKSNVLRLAV